MTTTLPLYRLKMDEEVQPRVEIDKDTVKEFAERIEQGDKMPPVIAFRDQDGIHWLADGYTRIAAYQRVGTDQVEVDVRPGERRDAILFAAGANRDHGNRLNNADKRKVVLTLLHDSEWRQWSNRRIADHCKVCHTLVDKIRKESDASQIAVAGSGENGNQLATVASGGLGNERLGRDGKKRSVTRIKRKKKAEPESDESEQPDQVDEPEVDMQPSTGECEVNGQVVPDTPKVSELRKKGKIPWGSRPLVQTGEPKTEEQVLSDEEEREHRRAMQEDSLSDELWLQALPAWSFLQKDEQAKTLKRFVADALLWRHTHAKRREHSKYMMTLINKNRLHGPFVKRIRRYLTIPHPAQWVYCGPLDRGGCAGIGAIPGMKGYCPKCNGHGFWIPVDP